MTSPIETATVRTELNQRVFSIEMHRPAKKNALNSNMYASLIESLKEAESNPEAHVIFLHGGRDCFTSGSDLQEFKQVQEDGTDRSHMGQNFLYAISQARKPIIAAVAGPAVGVGSTMLLHCDMVFAGAGAIFQFPFINLGLCPEAGSTFLLPKLVGHQNAAELLLLGEPFGADRALALGFVNRVLPDDTLLENALETARKMAAKPLASLLISKAFLKKSFAEDVKERIGEEGRSFTERLASVEARQAIESFLQRRK